MNLQDLLNDLGVDFRLVGEHHHATTGWCSIDCPFCSPGSGKFRLGLNIRFGAANCWSCGPKKISEVLYELTGSYSHLKSLHFDFSSDFTSSLPHKKPGKFKQPEGLSPGLLPVHISYLRQRKFDPDNLARLWGLRGFGLHHKYCWRIWIPILYRGEVVSFTTRSLSNEEPRYLNSPPEDEKLPLKDLLFGEDYARHAIVVCEGPFDAMAIGPGAVATCGVGYTAEQLAKMVTYPNRVVCFDSEPNAQIRAKELCRELALFPGQTSNITLETGKDPAEASEEEIQELRKEFLE